MPKGRGKGRKRKGPAQRVTPARNVLSEDQPGTSTAGLIPATDDPDTSQISQPSQTSRPSTASQQQQQQQEKNIRRHHTQMIIDLGDMFSPKQWRSICNRVEMMKYVSTRDMGDVDSMEDLCKALMRNGVIKHGEYSNLREILVTCDVEAGVIIDDYTERIHQEREGPSPAKQAKTRDQGQQYSTEIHPDLEPMIGTAKARIKKEKEEKKFYPTKGFCDAKDKLQKNRVVVIKGNTGDGKTAIAVQLLHWLSEEQQAGQPLQIHKIEDLRLLAPKLKLITYIDDIFGEKNVSKTDVQEWNKRISDVETLFVDKQTQTNFLIVTIRNEVFNSLQKRSPGTILIKDNIIDLSSHTYQFAEEKKELLELYKPKHFSWTDQEKKQISTYAPNIGFPQCCQLFYNSEELQKERVRFFENPFYFLNEALSRLQECSALLYLFLNGGMIRVNDLDPNSKKVDEKLLEEAFEINLIDGEDYRTKLTYKKKVGFVKETLEKLLGFLVVKETHFRFYVDFVAKEKHWSVEDVYRFNHDSIYVAVAFLYGKVTPIGYIQNCPSKSLSYLTTSETTANMIVISSDHYTEMCERLLREFESCSRSAEECALYLLCEGVEPDEDTVMCVVEGRSEEVLRKLLQYDVTPIARDFDSNNVLHWACVYERDEMVTLLCDTYPHLVHDTNMSGFTPIHAAAFGGKCSVFQIVERLF
ncbi:uncharacterized protein LOC110450736 [Mizuhopecten yessoensis]|uniref:uncharacterized protein LOC110450736 n=1 Tax=Mizuhopecten yessoensis TaxID=6573 RepID=UPI000B45B261|nr:uncharacterized protein LOC110450736 [Mizuhopecten yessoensis]